MPPGRPGSTPRWPGTRLQPRPRWAELLTYFDTDGASNGPTEAVNLLAEKARRLGHGFRNFDNYRLRLLLLRGVNWHTPLTPRIRSRHPRSVA
jgi:transposase